MFRLLPLLVLACLFAKIVSCDDFGRVKSWLFDRRQRRHLPTLHSSPPPPPHSSPQPPRHSSPPPPPPPFQPGKVQPKTARRKEFPEFFQFCHFRSLETADKVRDRFRRVEDLYLFVDHITRTYFALAPDDQLSMKNVRLPPDSLNNTQMLPFVSLLALVDPGNSRGLTGKVEFADRLLTILHRTFPVSQRLNNDQFVAFMQRAQDLYRELGVKNSSTTAAFVAHNRIPAEFIHITDAEMPAVMEFQKKLDGLLGGQGSSILRSFRVFGISGQPKPKLRVW